MRQALVIVARPPVFGIPDSPADPQVVTPAEIDLYTGFLREVVEMARTLDRVDITILHSRGHGEAAGLLRTLAPPSIRLKAQRGRSLAGALACVCRTHFRLGYGKVAILTPDSPSLPRRILDEAYRRLNVHDVVLGPRLDGTYYLVALRAFHTQFFVGTDWDSGRVVSQLVDQAYRLRLSLSLLPTRRDLDAIDDGDRLKREARSLRNEVDLQPARMVVWAAL